MSRVISWTRARRADLLVYALYLFLTAILAGRVLFQPATVLFGRHGDALLTVFWLWWFKIAWLRGLPSDPNPMVAAPFGADWGGVIEPGTVWPGALLSMLVNETFAYNVLVLISFPLAGIAAYHLALRLTGNRVASAVAGLIYTFCPYHLWKSWAWIPLSNIQWMPLYLLALLNLRRSGRLRDALLAGIWFGINFLTSYIYGIVLGVATMIYLAYAAVYAYVTRGRIVVTRRGFLLAGMVVLVAGALIMPVAAPVFGQMVTTAAQDTPYKFAWPISDLYGLVADPTDYFLPSDSSWLRSLSWGIDPGDWGRGDYTHGLFLGYGAMGLAIAAVVGWWRECKQLSFGQTRAFAVPLMGVLFVMGVLLSVTPPTLIFSLPGLGTVVLKGPGYLGYGLLPWFREYARFGVLAMLAVAVLAACGMAYLLRWLAGRVRWRIVLLILVTAVLAADYLPNPRAAGPQIPDVATQIAVYDWLKSQPNDVVVAEYPMPRSSQVSPYYLARVTQHGRPLINGHGFSFRADLLMPALWDLTDNQSPGVLSTLGADYVILHDRWPGYERWYAALPIRQLAQGLEPVQAFDTARVYRVKADPLPVIVAPGEGMLLAPENAGDTVWWWLTETGVLRLINTIETSMEVEVRFTVGVYGGDAQLLVALADGTTLPVRRIEGERDRLAVGPIRVPPSHLWKDKSPETMDLIVRATMAQRNAGIGLRDFAVVLP